MYTYIYSSSKQEKKYQENVYNRIYRLVFDTLSLSPLLSRHNLEIRKLLVEPVCVVLESWL